MTKICAFIPYLNNSITSDIVQEFSASLHIEKIYILSELNLGFNSDKVLELSIDHLKSTNSIRVIAKRTESEQSL